MTGLKLHQTIIALVFIGVWVMPFGVTAQESALPSKVAEINGKAITAKDFERELEFYQRRFKQQGGEVPEETQKQVRTDVLNELINRELLFQESRKQGIQISPQTVDNEMKAIRQRYPDKKEFDAVLDQMQLTEKDLKGQISRLAAIRGLIDKQITAKINITDDEAQKFYDANPNLFLQPEQVRARHILIKVKQDADDKQKAAARKQLVDIKKRLKAGEDFSELAKQHSQCPSSAQGGDLGYFSRGKMVKSFEDAAFGMAPDEVSDIVETNFGYHLIKVLDHRPSETVEFEKAKPKIMANLRNDRIQDQLMAYVEKLRKKAEIKTFLK